MELGRTTREPDNSTERVAPHMSKKERRLIAEKRRKAERKSAKKEKAKEEREAKQYEDISEARESVDPEEIIAPDEQVPAALTRKEKRLLAERRRKSARKSEKKAKTKEEAAAKAEADARAAAWQQARAKAEAERSKASNARPSLLALPAELRNEIWRLVLVQRQIIVINGPGYFHTEPGLLKVTMSIRQEASGIYYVDNKFACDIFDFDSTVFKRWVTVSPFRIYQDPAKPMLLGVARSTDWPNLKQWLKDVYEGKPLGIKSSETGREGYSHGYFAVQLFEIVRREMWAGAAWDSVEERLEHARQTIGCVWPEWLR